MPFFPGTGIDQFIEMADQYLMLRIDLPDPRAEIIGPGKTHNAAPFD
jgi:hypothetical protein